MINRRQFLQTSSLLTLSPLIVSANTNTVNADVAIIGSGPAGLSLATQLVQSGISVVVIESAPLIGYDQQVQERNKVLDAGNGLPYQVGYATKRMTGGTSTVWGGHSPRFQADDLICKSKFGYAADWPITYQELEHYYCDAERFLNVFNARDSCSGLQLTDDSFKLAENLRSYGFKETVAASVTVNTKGEYQPLRLQHERLSTLLANKKFSLVSNLTARNFETDKSGKIKSVICSGDAGKEIKIPCKTAVICCGAVQSARLLMLTNHARSGHGLGVDGGQLGANFMDHLAVKMTVQEKILPKQKKPPVNFGQAHIWQWYGRYRDQGIGAYLPMALQQDGIGNERSLKIGFLCEQEPQTKNRFELSKNEKDEFGDPLPTLWYENSVFDKRTCQHALDNLKHFLGNNDSLTMTDEIETYIGRHHLMGTTRMAMKDNEGVVDQNLKVFGSKNLYILGGSVFPSGGGANPTLTIAALGMRLAKYLTQNKG